MTLHPRHMTTIVSAIALIAALSAPVFAQDAMSSDAMATDAMSGEAMAPLVAPLAAGIVIRFVTSESETIYQSGLVGLAVR